MGQKVDTVARGPGGRRPGSPLVLLWDSVRFFPLRAFHISETGRHTTLLGCPLEPVEASSRL